MDSKRVLAETANYVLRHEYEYCTLLHKPSGQEVYVGDHYGDPGCGLISPDETWCVTGGAGVILYHLSAGEWIGFRRNVTESPSKELAVPEADDRNWLKGFAAEPCLFVEHMQFASPTEVRIELDPHSDYASVWRMDVTVKTLTRIR